MLNHGADFRGDGIQRVSSNTSSVVFTDSLFLAILAKFDTSKLTKHNSPSTD